MGLRSIERRGLHEVLQAAMGWSNSHLYEIYAAGVDWGD
jgi:Plasmid pRiA4b ORF-3-like protein